MIVSISAPRIWFVARVSSYGSIIEGASLSPRDALDRQPDLSQVTAALTIHDATRNVPGL